jgi:uncharacterized protein YegP (UPF0339 family)
MMDPKSTAKFEVYKGGPVGETDQPWRWHLFGANGEILASGEGHNSERDAYRACASVAAAAHAAYPALASVIGAKGYVIP